MKSYTLGEIREFEDPAYLIAPVLPERSLVLVHGHPGLGKSTLVLGWMMCLAHGEDWMDRPVPFHQVAYVWTEGHRGDLKKRHQACLEDMDVPMWSRNYRLVNEPVNLLDSTGVATFIDHLDDVGCQPKVIAFDSFHSCTPGAEENSAKDIGKALDSLFTLRDEFDCSIILVHHSRKDGLTERGHTSLKAAMDVQIAVSGTDTKSTVWVTSEKVRGGAPFRFPVERTVVSTRWGNTVILRPQGTPERIVSSLETVYRVFGEKPLETQAILQSVTVSRKQVFRALQELQEQGRIYKEKHGLYRKVSSPLPLRGET